MPTAKMIKKSPADVRKFFAENPDKVPTGDKSVGPNSAGRGRVSQPARKVFVEHNPGTEVVEKMVSKTITLDFIHTQPSGKKVSKTVALPVKEVRVLAGDKAKPVGRMTADAITAAAEAYAKVYAAEVKAAQKAKAAKAKAPKAAEAEVQETPADQ